jgi:hypothetical protein
MPRRRALAGHPAGKPYTIHREESMKTRYATSRLLSGVLFFGALFLCMMPAVSAAQEQPAPAVRTGTAVDAVIAEELNKLLGGWVSVTLDSGTVFSGKVMKVRDGMVHLGQVQNKEYYEALIRISNISALGARFRAKNKQ